MDSLKDVKKPWMFTFSYGRDNQKAALEAWKGKEENKEKAQKALLESVKRKGGGKGKEGEKESPAVKYTY